MIDETLPEGPMIPACYEPIRDAVEAVEGPLLQLSWDIARGFGFTPPAVVKILVKAAEKTSGMTRELEQMKTPLFLQYVAGKLGAV